MRKCVTSGRVFYDIRVVYALCGILLSIIAHELVHIIIHFGSMQSIHLFPDWYTIAAIESSVNGAYDTLLEEGIAYTMSTLVLGITVIDVFAIHDSRCDKSAHETISLGDIEPSFAAEQLERVVFSKSF